MTELTKEECKLISDFIGNMNWYEIMNVLNRTYVSDELEDCREDLLKAVRKLERGGSSA